MTLTESQIKILKIGVPIFCGLVVIAIIAGIVIFIKKAADKAAAEKPAADKAATDKAAVTNKAAVTKDATDKAAADKAVADKAAADKAAADKAAADKAAADKAAADKVVADKADAKAKAAIIAFNTEITKRDQSIQKYGPSANNIELFYNAAKAAVVAEKESKDNYDLQITFNNNTLLIKEANTMYDKAKADTTLAKDAVRTKLRWGYTNYDFQQVNNWLNELNINMG